MSDPSARLGSSAPSACRSTPRVTPRVTRAAHHVPQRATCAVTQSRALHLATERPTHSGAIAMGLALSRGLSCACFSVHLTARVQKHDLNEELSYSALGCTRHHTRTITRTPGRFLKEVVFKNRGRDMLTLARAYVPLRGRSGAGMRVLMAGGAVRRGHLQYFRHLQALQAGQRARAAARGAAVLRHSLCDGTRHPRILVLQRALLIFKKQNKTP